MERIHLGNIKPLSDFRNNVSAYIKHVRETKAPIVITQHGKSAVVLLDAEEYEALQEHLEFTHEIQLAEIELSEGKEISHNEVKKRLILKSNK